MAHGMLTEEITQKSKELLGYEISQTELRLMPYLIYCVTNESNINIAKINVEERKILSKWEKKGYIKSVLTDLGIKKEFYDIANELIFIYYVKSVGHEI